VAIVAGGVVAHPASASAASDTVAANLVKSLLLLIFFGFALSPD